MGMGHRHGGYWGGFSHNGPGALGILMFIVFWAAVALVILLLVQHYRRGPHHLHEHGHGPGFGPGHAPGPVSPPVISNVAANPAIDILRERFARGEVSEEEFTRRLAMLKDS